MNSDVYGTVYRGGSATCLARLVGEDAQAISRTDVASAEYTIWLLERDDPDARTPVAGHEQVAVNVATNVFDSLQTDARWTADELGYNFRHTIDIASDPAFTLAGRDYLVEYAFTPYAGQVFLARFRFHCI